MFTTTIKSLADNKRVLNLAISGVIVSSEYWEDETGFDRVSSVINEFNAVEGDEIIVSINSPGGDYFAGVAIYNTLKNSPAKVTTKNMGLAASAACVIFMAGDERIVYPGTSTMTHDPLTNAYGNADDLRELANELDNICESVKGVFTVAGIDAVKLVDLMKAETMMPPQQALDYGFATSYNESLMVQNCASKRDTKLAIQNSFAHKVKPPQETPIIENKASSEFIMNTLIENNAFEHAAFFNKKEFTEREINASISCIVEVKNVCAATGVNYDNVKSDVFNTGDLLRAFATDLANNEDLNIDSGSNLGTDAFSIKPITGC